MKIETERLEILALTPVQIRLWIENMPILEEKINCCYKAESLEGLFLEIVKHQLSIAENDGTNYFWHGFWFLIRKEDRTVIGSADFKDRPNEKGEVEIGYGLGKSFQHSGYMTEAVHAMCNWALQQKKVAHVIAETDLDGVASQRILRRCGFISTKADKDSLWWIL